MIPELFRIGNFPISPFGLMIVLAFVAGYFQLSRGLRRNGIGDEEDASSIVFAGGLGGIVGAKVYYAVLHHDWRLIFDRSGLVWYGGFSLAALLVAWVIRRRGLRFVATADVVLVSMAIGYAVGRIGCFLVGDDYGMPTDLPWGVKFPYGLPATTAASLRREFGADIPLDVPPDTLIPVHPTQLYETAIALGIWAVGRAMLRRRVRPGGTALAVAALLAAERFGIEFLRAKDDRFVDDFTLAQVISALLLVLVLALWVRWWRAGKPGAA
jgi:phosphatidylglycerol:prolipoprotein diacylglycerol transferase